MQLQLFINGSVNVKYISSIYVVVLSNMTTLKINNNIFSVRKHVPALLVLELKTEINTRHETQCKYFFIYRVTFSVFQTCSVSVKYRFLVRFYFHYH